MQNEDRTLRWLTDVVAEDHGKILFMVDLLDGKTIGHVGLGFIQWDSGYAEADAIVRGLPAPKGLMTKALRSLLSWARTSLGLANIWVRVRSDNPAIEFYRKVGFVEKKRVDLVFEDVENGRRWYELPGTLSSIASLVHMEYSGNENC